MSQTVSVQLCGAWRLWVVVLSGVAAYAFSVWRAVLRGSGECWVYARTNGAGRNGMDRDLVGTRNSTKWHRYLVL